jgi:thymidylate synthase ThyX
VGDMADLFLCIEDVPMYSLMKIFYSSPVVSGQERSTRYQNFESPEFVKIPKELCEDRDIRKGYERILLKQMRDYRELLKPTKEMMKKYFELNSDNKQEKSVLMARSFDIARYLLPYGLHTSAAFLMSARSWSEAISYLCASDSVVDNEISDLLLELLSKTEDEIKDYIKEADGLIRHTDPNCCRKNSTRDVLDYLKRVVSSRQRKDIEEYEYDAFNVSYNTDCVEELFGHYEDLIHPLGSVQELTFSEKDQQAIGEILFENHDHYNQIGSIAQSGAIRISGFASLGTLKDLNRHRSLERYIPFLHDEIDMDMELNRRDNYFYLCNYLYIPEFSKLKKDYESRLKDTYKMIKEWRKLAKGVIAESVVDEYTKYLLPHAHATKYNFYGSIDDFQYVINLRVRNGGHIAYRKLVYEWLRKLSVRDPLWKPLLRKKIEPKADSRDQLLDRS